MAVIIQAAEPLDQVIVPKLDLELHHMLSCDIARSPHSAVQMT